MDKFPWDFHYEQGPDRALEFAVRLSEMVVYTISKHSSLEGKSDTYIHKEFGRDSEIVVRVICYSKDSMKIMLQCKKSIEQSVVTPYFALCVWPELVRVS